MYCRSSSDKPQEVKIAKGMYRPETVRCQRNVTPSILANMEFSYLIKFPWIQWKTALFHFEHSLCPCCQDVTLVLHFASVFVITLQSFAINMLILKYLLTWLAILLLLCWLVSLVLGRCGSVTIALLGENICDRSQVALFISYKKRKSFLFPLTIF